MLFRRRCHAAAVRTKYRCRTVVIIRKRRMSAVYGYGHRYGISGLVGHNNGLFSVSRIKRTLSVCKRDRVSVDGDIVKICLFYRNNLGFAIYLAVCNSGNNRAV